MPMVRQWQTLFYDSRYSNTDLNTGPEEIGALRIPDFVKLAEAMTELVGMLQVAADLDSPDEMFAALDEREIVFRLDPSVRPTKWKCATVSREELPQLRRIADVVRLGRVQRVSRGSITLVDGQREVPENSLFIDCTADGLATKEPKPIFTAGSITLQSVFMRA